MKTLLIVWPIDAPKFLIDASLEEAQRLYPEAMAISPATEKDVILKEDIEAFHEEYSASIVGCGAPPPASPPTVAAVNSRWNCYGSCNQPDYANVTLSNGDTVIIGGNPSVGQTAYYHLEEGWFNFPPEVE